MNPSSSQPSKISITPEEINAPRASSARVTVDLGANPDAPASKTVVDRTILLAAVSIGMVVLLLLILVVFFAINRNADFLKPLDRNRDPIQKILVAEEEFGRRFEGNATASPAERLKQVDEYCQYLESLSLSDCPPDFRVTYRKFLRSFREMEATLKQVPGDFTDGFVTGFFNTFVRGEQDGGLSRMEDAVQEAHRQLKMSRDDVEAVAVSYGAAL